MWQVYILLSVQYRKTYVGSTNNLQKRFYKHNKGLVSSTKRYIPWVPVYVEFYPDEKSARERERKLKTSVGRRYLKKVINEVIKKWSGSSAG